VAGFGQATSSKYAISGEVASGVTLSLERFDRPIAKSDVLKAIKEKSSNPQNILVTRDPGGVVGWTKLEEFFVT